MTVLTPAQITRFQSLETPFYYYDLDLLEATLKACKTEADRYGFHVHYAMKANFNPRVLSVISKHGFGADCVSGNEVKKAVEMGFPADRVVFAGVGKSDKEIIEALALDIFCFNVESVQELQVIDALAKKTGKTATIALRINPNVDAKTHYNITTGLDENKFGINQSELPGCVDVLKKCSNVKMTGIHFHVGSQILDLSVFRELCDAVNGIADWFESQGIMITILNVGGGLGIDYKHPQDNPIPAFADYFKIFHENLRVKSYQHVHFELGRALVAQSGALISRVLYIKNGIKKNFAILDAGMTELIRPMLYQAYHKIENLTSSSEKKISYDIVGPICESTDVFSKDLSLPETQRGDLVAIYSTGAYGEVMASDYNLRGHIAAVYSND